MDKKKFFLSETCTHNLDVHVCLPTFLLRIDPVSAKYSTSQVKTEMKTAACECFLIAPELCSDSVHSYML